MRLFVEVQRRGILEVATGLSGRKLVGARNRPHAVQCVRAAPTPVFSSLSYSSHSTFRSPCWGLGRAGSGPVCNAISMLNAASSTSLDCPEADTHDRRLRVVGPSSLRSQDRSVFGAFAPGRLGEWERGRMTAAISGCWASIRQQCPRCRRAPVCRWLWAGSTRVSLERVCESLDGPRGDGIREAERAEWQLKDNTVGQRKLSHRALRSLPQSRRIELPVG
jgi:hypothetical protein